MRNTLFSIAIITLLSFFLSTEVSASKGGISPKSLRCENLKNPTVVDNSVPRLSWINEANSTDSRGEYQTAYRIIVSSSKNSINKGKGDIWDSGKVKSKESSLISYLGSTKLESGKDYYWKVMVWDKNGKPSDWSEYATWGMGLMSQDEWKAKWIGAPWQGENARMTKGEPKPEGGYISYPAPIFRKSFSTDKKIASAKAFVTGLGFFELYVNGEKVGDDCLVPNLTNYSVRNDLHKAGLAIDNNFTGYRVMYLVYDVTDKLNEGKNAIGAWVGDGFYDCTSHWISAFGSPRFICQLAIEYTDGIKELVCTDETWKVKASPIVMNGIYDGEIYDARQETAGWCKAGIDETDWKQVVLRQAPTGKLVANTSPTDKVTEKLKPISIEKDSEGQFVVDFGKEISGWIKLEGLNGKAGDTINVKYVCESPLGVHKYVCKGGGNESHTPRFTWYVFRKAIISGADNLTNSNLTAEAVNTDIEINSEFTTSNSLFNQINEIWRRSQIDNMHGGIASDCPHRERSAYTGDGQVSCVTVMHNFDAAAFYTKWIADMRDAQNIEDGYVPDSAPWQPGCGGGVGWGAAMNIMPWEYYVHYGDKKMLYDCYDAMKKQLAYMQTWITPEGTMFMKKCNVGSNEPNYWFNLGDWAPAFGLPSDELVHTFFLWRCADYTAKTAKALGLEDDYKKYSNIAKEVNNAFHKKFYDKQNKTYGDYGSNVFALVMGVPQGYYSDVLNTFKKEITEKYDNHLNTGIFGTQFLFETLAANEMNDVAYEVMNKMDFPSFGNWIAQGATTTWEQWNGKDSHNHPMFGGGLTWFYRTIAGVYADEQQPGFRHIIIKPQLPEKLDQASYSTITPYGKVSSEVIKSGNQTSMNVSIPVGCKATVYLPTNDATKVKEGGKPLSSIGNDITILPSGDNFVAVSINQGNYNFLIEK